MSLKTRWILGFVFSLTFGVGVQLAIQASSQSPNPAAMKLAKMLPLQNSPQSVQAIAKAITVKILLPEGGQGSGIIVRQQKGQYLVLTNQHVLLQGQPMQVQTPDHKIYRAALVSNADFRGKDLALVQFQSSQVSYQVAAIATSDKLRANDVVFATGFPNDIERPKGDGFKFTKGRVSFFTPKVMTGGYCMGYTNEIVKGMSGGPVLNQRGQVVAVNGMHAYPLWGDPYIFEDGSRPNTSLQTKMVSLSWAIPIETALKLAPQALKTTN
jgi:S1-C subfamily serine protease